MQEAFADEKEGRTFFPANRCLVGEIAADIPVPVVAVFGHRDER